MFILDLAAKSYRCNYESFSDIVLRNILKGTITPATLSNSYYINSNYFMFFSIRALTVDLFTIVSNNIEVIITKIMLIQSKHLCNHDIVRSSSHLSTSSIIDLLVLNSILFKRTRSRTRLNRSYMKSCIYRSANSSLLKGGKVGRGGLEEVSRIRHFRTFRVLD